jgi:hypothetical protein
MDRARAGAAVHVPQPAAVPAACVFPVGAVDQRVHADAFERHARGAAAQGGRGHLVDPLRAAVAHVPGFRNEHGPLVAPPRIAEHRGEVTPPRIAQVPEEPLVARVLPLVAVVIVDAQHVEVARRAAQPGSSLPQSMSQAWYCSALRACASAVQSGRSAAGTTCIRGSVCTMRASGQVAHSASVPCSAARTRLHLSAKPRAGELGWKGWMSDVLLAAQLRNEISLTGWNSSGPSPPSRRRAGCVPLRRRSRRSARKVGREHVHAVRHAVVMQRPDDLQPEPRGGLRGAQEPASSDLGAFGHERAPADALADGADAQAREQRVVFLQPLPWPLHRFIATCSPRLLRWSAPS